MSEDVRFIKELRRQLVAAAGDERRAGRARLRRNTTKASVLIAATLVGVAGVLGPIRWLSALGDRDHSVASVGESSVGGSLGNPGALTVSTFDVEPGITGLAFGFGSLWVAGQQSVNRIDTTSGEIEATIPFDGDDYGKVVIGPDAVWVSGGGPSVSKIDPTENAIVATVKIGGEIRGLTLGGGDLWVSSSTEGGQLVQIALADASVEAKLPVTSGPLQYAEGVVWVFGGGPPIQVDAQTLTTEKTDVSVEGPAVVDAGYIWAISTDLTNASSATVSKMDIDTGDVSTSTPIPRAAAIGLDASGIWVLSTPGSTSTELYIPDPAQPATVTLIDADTGLVKAGPVAVDVTPARMSVGDGSLWIAHYETGVVTRVDA